MKDTDKRKYNVGKAQPGAGRPKSEPTKTIRVPLRLVPEILILITNKKTK